MVWLEFLCCAAIILFAGTRVARYGDAIAKQTGLGGVWVGLVLLAAVTAMPELVTAVSSVALVKLPNLALGTLVGSCLFNLSILIVLDMLSRGTPILSRVGRIHAASAGLGILLAAVVGIFILTGEGLSRLAVGWVGVPSIIVAVLYLLAMWLLYRLERKHQSLLSPVTPQLYERAMMKRIYFKFVLAALAVVAAGIWISFVGDRMAQTYGWDTSFIGGLFLAVATSLPELVVTITALKLDAADMALGDIMGANLFDLANVLAADIFYTRGPLLSLVSADHLITLIAVILMKVVVIAGVMLRTKRKTFFAVSWYSGLLLVLYILGSYLLFIGATSG